MPLIARPSASLTYSMVDGTGSRASMSFDVPYATLASVALAGAATLRPLLQTLTGCIITGYSLTYSEVDNAPAAADVDSRVERKGVVQFLTAAGKTVSYAIPGIKPTYEKSSGALNEDWPAMQAFVNGIVYVGTIFCDSNGVDLTQYKGAYERFRASTRADLPSDTRPDADLLP